MLQAETIPATDSRLVWMGRTRVDGSSVQLGFPGIVLSLRTNSPRLWLDAEATTPDCWFDLEIDGELMPPFCLPEGRTTFELPETLAGRGPQDVRIIRRTESWQGIVTLNGIELAAQGQLLDPPRAPDRRLMCIGDSITCGSGADKLPPAYPEGAIGNNANKAFSRELGRRLEAQVHLVSYGGKGVTRDWEGKLESEVVTAPQFFERSMPDDPSAKWDHSRYSPDAVTICLGTNDFNQGIPDEVEWTTAFAGFATRVREVHPHAWIFLVTSPIWAAGENLKSRVRSTALEHFLHRTAFLRLEDGDDRIEIVAVRGQAGTEKDGHPIAPQHLKIADDLEPVLRSRLGWR